MTRCGGREPGERISAVERLHPAAILISLLALALITGCVDDQSGRQFASDPRLTAELPTIVPTWTPPLPLAATPLASPISLEQLLRPRGSTGRFYFESDGELWTMAPEADHLEPIFNPPVGTTIRALSPSPSGDRVAAVVVGDEDGVEVADLVVLSKDGEELHRYDGIESVADHEGSHVASLDWSPQGEKLLVALAPGGLVSVPLSEGEEPELIVKGGPAAEPHMAAWSPTGEEVGFLADTEPDRSSLYLAGAIATPGEPTALLPDDESAHSIYDWAWLPDGRSVIFSEQRGLTGNADLWRIKSDGTGRKLVASAGSVAPVARVIGATPSRDGRAVAYVVLIPGENRDQFHSLWVRDLVTGQGFQVEVPSGQAVTDIWWTDAGLMFRAVPDPLFAGDYREGPFALYQARHGPEAELVFEVGMDAPATPAASPVATG